MKSLLKGVLSIGLGVMLCFTSCSNGSDDPTFIIPNVNNSTGPNVNNLNVINNSVAGIKFDFSGAKALAAVNSTATTQSVINSTSTIQAAESETSSPLIKILEDGSSADAVSLTGNGNLSTIKKIYKSPLSTSSDVFVVFDNQSWINNNGKSYTLGTFVCVHADGTVADILKKAETSNGGVNYYWLYNNNVIDEIVKFDGSGNAYFMMSDNNNETVICKFNPGDNTMTKLTAGVRGTNYDKFLITSDGQLIIVSGARWNNGVNSAFLRAIPISDPDHFTNIYYSSTNSSYPNWTYDDQNGICYFSDWSEEGLSRCIRNGTKFSEAEKFGSRIWWDSPIMYNNGNTYIWDSKFLKNDGSVNAKAVLDYMFKRCWTSGEKEFKLTFFQNYEYNYTNYADLYSTLKDEDAINWISSESSRMQLFSSYISNNWNNNIGYAESLRNIIFKKGSSESAYRSISDDETKISHYWRENDFYFSNSEGLWMNYSYNGNGNNAFYVVHVVDSKGYPVWEASKKDLPSGKMTTSQVINNTIYMSYSLLTSSGAETGFHQIYSVNLDTGAYKNLFQNVPNNSNLEVISYSVGSNKLYYSAVRGTAVENGVVDVTTGEYSPLSTKKKLTAIYTF